MEGTPAGRSEEESRDTVSGMAITALNLVILVELERFGSFLCCKSQKKQLLEQVVVNMISAGTLKRATHGRLRSGLENKRPSRDGTQEDGWTIKGESKSIKKGFRALAAWCFIARFQAGLLKQSSFNKSFLMEARGEGLIIDGGEEPGPWISSVFDITDVLWSRLMIMAQSSAQMLNV